MYEDYFSQRLSSLRIHKQVSAREMSLSLGQCAGYINAIENQKALPSMTSFFYICEYLKITPCDFFNTNTPYPDELMGLINTLRQLNAEQLRHLEYIANQMVRAK